MEPIVIEASSHSPLVDFNPNGKLKLEGRAIPENVFLLFNPLIEFSRDLDGVDVTFDVNLDYFNTATSKKLMELFKTIDSNTKLGKILVNWHYEEGDDDSLEMAEIYEESVMRTEFRYHEYAELVTQ
jgi:hypothetical protein